MGIFALVLFGAHLVLTVRTGFVQRLLFRAEPGQTRDGGAGVSSAQALAAQLAACLGTGNLVGISTAVALGGPGAVVWCWLAGVLGMATRYAESYLGVRYRQPLPGGGYRGGAAVLLERQGLPLAGRLFSLALVCGSLLTGAVLQSQAVVLAAAGLRRCTRPALAAVALTLLAAPPVLAGTRGAVRLCQRLVPFMAGLYLLALAALLWQWRDTLPAALCAMLRGAVGLRAAGGGVSAAALAAAVRYGVSRGLFSNEAGLGTAPVLDAQVPGADPHRQALVSMSGVFWDTVVVCGLTGLAVVTAGLRMPAALTLAGPEGLTRMAFAAGLPGGAAVFAAALTCFAYTSVVGCSVFCVTGARELWGKASERPVRLAYLTAAALAPLIPAAAAWRAAELCSCAMALPNLLAVMRSLAGLRPGSEIRSSTG